MKSTKLFEYANTAWANGLSCLERSLKGMCKEAKRLVAKANGRAETIRRLLLEADMDADALHDRRGRCDRAELENKRLRAACEVKDKRISHLEDSLDTVRKGADEYRAFVERFPLTIDGVRCYPGMPLYKVRIKPCGCAVIDELLNGDTVERGSDGDFLARRFGHIGGWLVAVEECYGVREHAQNAAHHLEMKDD